MRHSKIKKTKEFKFKKIYKCLYIYIFVFLFYYSPFLFWTFFKRNYKGNFNNIDNYIFTIHAKWSNKIWEFFLWLSKKLVMNKLNENVRGVFFKNDKKNCTKNFNKKIKFFLIKFLRRKNLEIWVECFSKITNKYLPAFFLKGIFYLKTKLLSNF